MDDPNQQPNQQAQPHIHQTVVVVGHAKSVGLAFILAFLFGPLGLLYASVIGGVVMFVLGILIAIVTFGFGLVFVWIGCMIWAVIAANNENKMMAASGGLHIGSNVGRQPAPSAPTLVTAPPPQNVRAESNAPSSAPEGAEQAGVKQSHFHTTTPSTTPSFDLAQWFDRNKRSVFLGAGFIAGGLVLIVAAKFVASIDFTKGSAGEPGVRSASKPLTAPTVSDPTNTPAPAVAVSAMSPSVLSMADFGGRWKKVKVDGGQMLADFLTIDVEDRGEISIKEDGGSLLENGEFQQATFKNGVIAGLYTFTGDNEHTSAFQLRGVSKDKIVYMEERGEETFTRVSDAFAGTWEGDQLRFVVTKAGNAYKIVMTNYGITGSPSSTFSGTLKEGKLQFSGKEQDYYKFQIPTLETLPTGKLMYRDGADDVEVSRKN